MELKYLNTFRTIVETGSFTKAAEKLNYTQSAITFQIDQLEQELSAQLFEKVGRRMALTKAGELLIPYVDEVLGAVGNSAFSNRNFPCATEISRWVSEKPFSVTACPPVLKNFIKQLQKPGFISIP